MALKCRDDTYLSYHQVLPPLCAIPTGETQIQASDDSDIRELLICELVSVSCHSFAEILVTNIKKRCSSLIGYFVNL